MEGWCKKSGLCEGGFITVRVCVCVCVCVLNLKAVSVNEEVLKLHCQNRRCSDVSGVVCYDTV